VIANAGVEAFFPKRRRVVGALAALAIAPATALAAGSQPVRGP